MRTQPFATRRRTQTNYPLRDRLRSQQSSSPDALVSRSQSKSGLVFQAEQRVESPRTPSPRP